MAEKVVQYGGMEYVDSIPSGGRQLPPDFVSMITSCLSETLWEYLKHKGVPREVLSAVSILEMLLIHSTQLKYGDLSDEDARDLEESITEVPWLINRLGGSFLPGLDEFNPEKIKIS